MMDFSKQLHWPNTSDQMISLEVSAFGKDILIALLDKGLLAGIVIGVGYYFNRLLHEKKARDSMLEAIVEQRITAYKKLWEATQMVQYARMEEISEAEKVALSDKLSEWYYKDGGAMFLSFKASKLYGEAKEILLDAESDFRTIKNAFSALRAQLKSDLKIYTEAEENMQTINPDRIFKQKEEKEK